MKIKIVTLGCKLNFAESSALMHQLLSEGHTRVKAGEQADLVIVNTCTVTDTADHKDRQAIHRVRREHPSAKIVITGCYAALLKLKQERNETLSCADTTILDEIDVLQPKDLVNFVNAYSRDDRTRCFLKVQDGCNNYCAYCTVPYARGRSRNIPVCEAVRMAQEIAAQGVKEIVLTGVNTGDFGRTTGESFLDLLKALNEVQGIERYRISSIEPNLLTEEIVDWIASGTKFQPHFHIPLQTGCDELLKRMGRRYTTAEFAGKLQMIRSKMEKPGAEKVFFGIDVMVGLPGETPELFAQTCSFLERIRPAFIHIFPYSKRPGTRAAEMPDQVPESIKKERVATLEALCDRLHAEFVEANRGVPAKVLWESKEKDGSMGGYTGNYIRITRPYDAQLSGRITEITI